MSIYCQLTEHKKDNSDRVYRKCNTTSDKKLDSEQCLYNTTLKKCYTRKNTNKKNTPKTKKNTNKTENTQKNQKQQNNQDYDTNTNIKTIPVFFRDIFTLDSIQKYRTFIQNKKLDPKDETNPIKLHNNLRNNLYDSNQVGSFWINYFLEK